ICSLDVAVTKGKDARWVVDSCHLFFLKSLAGSTWSAAGPSCPPACGSVRDQITVTRGLGVLLILKKDPLWASYHHITGPRHQGSVDELITERRG
ncbi:hypothetical protein KUCAC02_015304, partial [Chaenocephalus aceratus]